MVNNQTMKVRTNRSASIHCISTPLPARRSSQDLNIWRNEFYFHGREIGRGHFSKVFHVTSIRNNVECAAKVIRRRRGGADRIQSIRQEIRIMQSLWNSNIRSVVQLYNFHETMVEVALIMELAKGGSLYHAVQIHPQGLPEEYVQQVTKKLLSALDTLHNLNIAHLDLKADNILLRQPYPSTDIALSDFGLAVQLNDKQIHRELVGTPDYIAPEIINYEEISLYTDMWSLGVLTYYLLTSKSPFLGDSKEMTMMNVSKINYFFPEIFDSSMELSKNFISRLIVKKPSMRMTVSEANNHTWLSSVIIDNCSVTNAETEFELIPFANEKSDLELLEESKSESDSGYESIISLR